MRRELLWTENVDEVTISRTGPDQDCSVPDDDDDLLLKCITLKLQLQCFESHFVCQYSVKVLVRLSVKNIRKLTVYVILY